MDNKKNSKGHLSLDLPDQAIVDYLDALLSEVADIAEQDDEAAARVELEALAPERASVPHAEIQIPNALVPGQQPSPSLSQEPDAAEDRVGRHHPPQVPHWAASPFQCLLVKMSGLKVGIPLVLLNSIAEWRGQAVHLPGQPAWHLGLMEHRGAKVTLVDTALLVMPEKAGSTLAGERSRSASHVLIVGEGRWGLLCDRLLSPIMLDPAKVHWRDARGNRPWMVGTLPEQLCILLDVDVLLDSIGHG